MMTTDAPLTEEEFSRHLNTSFRCSLDESRQVELKLVEVAGYKERPNEQQGMERFSLYFEGPAEPHLPQRTYTLAHERMGTHDIFIVPVARSADGFRYQAVFNYFRQ
jgi:hypothetical protein